MPAQMLLKVVTQGSRLNCTQAFEINFTTEVINNTVINFTVTVINSHIYIIA